MNPIVSRPSIDDLLFCFYARSLHPELHDTQASLVHDGKAYQLDVKITKTGHLIEFVSHQQKVTEVLCSQFSEIPSIRRLGRFPLSRSRSLDYQLDSGVSFQICFDCERFSESVYARVEEEYWKDASVASITQVFDSDSTSQSSALSFSRVEAYQDSVNIHFFHLYPEEQAIVKSQTLIQLPLDEVDDHQEQ